EGVALVQGLSRGQARERGRRRGDLAGGGLAPGEAVVALADHEAEPQAHPGAALQGLVQRIVVPVADPVADPAVRDLYHQGVLFEEEGARVLQPVLDAGSRQFVFDDAQGLGPEFFQAARLHCTAPRKVVHSLSTNRRVTAGCGTVPGPLRPDRTRETGYADPTPRCGAGLCPVGDSLAAGAAG